LLKTEWKHVNIEQRTRFIPAANTKGEHGRNRDQLIYALLDNATRDQRPYAFISGWHGEDDVKPERVDATTDAAGVVAP
jgi:hypothetical protein